MCWNEFVKALLHRFGPTDYDDPAESLSRLKQQTTVHAYQEALEKLSHKVDDLPKNFLVGCFIAGLKDEIHLDVRVKQPKTLFESISVAHLIEERNQFQRKTGNQIQPVALSYHPRPQQSSTGGILGPSLSQRTPLPTSNFSGLVRRLMRHEARERREKGLCFYCDDRYVPGHRCSRPRLFMMVDVQPNEQEDDLDMNIESSKEAIPEISFHALAGPTHPHTFRVIRRVGWCSLIGEAPIILSIKLGL